MTPELIRLLIIILFFAMLGYGLGALIIMAIGGVPRRVAPPPSQQRRR